MNTQIRNPNIPNEDIEEIGFALVGNNLNPMMLTYEFLTSSGIVPRDWELSKQPVTSQRMSQINFQNGLSIVAQPGTVNFVEGIAGKKVQDIKGANLVLEYVDKLPHAEYQRLGINPKIIVPLSDTDPNAGKTFIVDVLLGSGSWKNFGQGPLQAGINLSYQLEQGVLNLSINEAKIQLPNKLTISSLLFSGNFNYELSSDDDQSKITLLKQQLNLWQENLTTFREIVKQKFLQQATSSQDSLFPSI
ncbi:hypothetical protein [Gloeocapsa sp. PCC 73106]|uniref:hypothetical protein n=1 Tax=Gloeocapsa sp. PCC 73106 TaxID=102232 RepID=UPI0002AC7ED1|nr:hypothetical protein [Gloeocapsa sp. PCC 73106]ELR97418.1 hypothetical protein GLO73106DRAFT_00012280 [Gloeocapsa sp. PCC 73106]